MDCKYTQEKDEYNHSNEVLTQWSEEIEPLEFYVMNEIEEHKTEEEFEVPIELGILEINDLISYAEFEEEVQSFEVVLEKELKLEKDETTLFQKGIK